MIQTPALVRAALNGGSMPYPLAQLDLEREIAEGAVRRPRWGWRRCGRKEPLVGAAIAACLGAFAFEDCIVVPFRVAA